METPPPSVEAAAEPPFALQVSMPAPGRAETSLIGDLDLANAPLMRDELIDRLEEGLDGLSIDLTRLGFLDSTGIAALVVVRKRALELGVDFRVHSPQASVWEVLHACGVDELFGLSPDGDSTPDPAA